MAALPLHPRLAALAFAADELGAGVEGCIAAAALSTGERLPDEAAVHNELNRRHGGFSRARAAG